jgi:hypothetical protein
MSGRERETGILFKTSLLQRLWSGRKTDSGMNIFLRFLLSACDLKNVCVWKKTAVNMLKILGAIAKFISPWRPGGREFSSNVSQIVSTQHHLK